MRTGAEYREALRDGRRVWVMGEGMIDDVTTHPATRAMVDEYVAWYDLLRDPAWRTSRSRPIRRHTLGLCRAEDGDDLGGMGRFFAATTFLSAGNITHTPCYGHMIALGILASAQERALAEQIANAARYRAMIAETGRFLTFCGGGPTIGYRMRENLAERTALDRSRDRRRDRRQGQDRHAHEPGLCRGRLCRRISGSRSAGTETFIVQVAAPASPRCAARSRCATRTRSSRP